MCIWLKSLSFTASKIITILTKLKLFSNFRRIPFDYLLIQWVTNYTYCGLLTAKPCHDNIVISYVKLQINADI